MEPEVSLPCSKDLSIKPYPEPVEFISHLAFYISSILILSSKRYLILQNCFYISGIKRNSSFYVSSARFLSLACFVFFIQSLLSCSSPLFVPSSLTAAYCSSSFHLFLGLSGSLFPPSLPSRIHEYEYYN